MKIEIELEEETLQMLLELAELEGVSQDTMINICIRNDLERGEASIIRQSMRQTAQLGWGF